MGKNRKNNGKSEPKETENIFDKIPKNLGGRLQVYNTNGHMGGGEYSLNEIRSIIEEGSLDDMKFRVTMPDSINPSSIHNPTVGAWKNEILDLLQEGNGMNISILNLSEGNLFDMTLFGDKNMLLSHPDEAKYADYARKLFNV